MCLQCFIYLLTFHETHRFRFRFMWYWPPAYTQYTYTNEYKEIMYVKQSGAKLINYNSFLSCRSLTQSWSNHFLFNLITLLIHLHTLVLLKQLLQDRIRSSNFFKREFNSQFWLSKFKSKLSKLPSSMLFPISEKKTFLLDPYQKKYKRL